MANRGVNIPKVPIDPDAFIKEIGDAGYSIRGIAKYSGCGERTIRYYLKRKEMPVVMMTKINVVLGKKKRMVDADLVIRKLKSIHPKIDKLGRQGKTMFTADHFHKFIDNTVDFIERNIEEV